MNTYGIDLMGRRRRRRHSAEFKAAVIRECMKPGVSMAAVALAHSLNANMLRKWVIEAEHAGVTAQPPAPAVQTCEEVRLPPPTFVPLALPAPVVEGEIRIELHRAGTKVSIVWPAAAARECAAWLSDWLR
jgi:transposase